MAEKPILFSGPMVRAILDGRKTQTRRVIKPQPLFLESGGCWYPPGPDKRAMHYASESHFRKGVAADFAPYRPGDTLWVRETWRLASSIDEDLSWANKDHVYYRADGDYSPGPKWRPSIFMPRWASRIDLRVTDVRAERLQDISRADAKAEGFWPGRNGLEKWGGRSYGNAQLAFEAAWNDLNGKRGHPWRDNPWVWVYTFERIKP